MPDHQQAIWHNDWLALNDERIRHKEARCDLHRELERRPEWKRLSEAQRIEVQRVSGLTEIEGTIDAVQQRLDRALEKMPTGPSRDYDAVLANLRVADRLICPEENEVVSGLLSRAVRDMAAIRDRS